MKNSEALQVITVVIDAAFKGGAFQSVKDAARAVEALQVIQMAVPADGEEKEK